MPPPVLVGGEPPLLGLRQLLSHKVVRRAPQLHPRTLVLRLLARLVPPVRHHLCNMLLVPPRGIGHHLRQLPLLLLVTQRLLLDVRGSSELLFSVFILPIKSNTAFFFNEDLLLESLRFLCLTGDLLLECFLLGGDLDRLLRRGESDGLLFFLGGKLDGDLLRGGKLEDDLLLGGDLIGDPLLLDLELLLSRLLLSGDRGL